MKNILKLFNCFLFISAFIIGCNQVEKKNNMEPENSEISNETGTSVSQSDPPSISFKMKLWQKGIDFYARGNEPSWAVDIDMEKGIKFSNIDGFIIKTTSFEIHHAADALVTRISGSGDSAEIFVTISEEDCSDTMADEKLKNSVSVEIKREGDTEFDAYTGCGQYVPDYRLHDIWVLIDVNGKAVDVERFDEKGSPTFEFYVEDGRLSGHAGCNNFNGSFYRAGEDIIHFEPFAMTRMMCPDMDLENLVAQSVAGRRMKYEINDLTLLLKGYDGAELKFKRID